MNSVFLLWHARNLEQDDSDAKLIGVYRTENDAKSAIERLRSKPGFEAEPNGFTYERYELNQDHWTEGFVYSPT
jgi:hypothetical protein